MRENEKLQRATLVAKASTRPPALVEPRMLQCLVDYAHALQPEDWLNMLARGDKPGWMVLNGRYAGQPIRGRQRAEGCALMRTPSRSQCRRRTIVIERRQKGNNVETVQN
jgi:hypothetical protein